MAIARSAGDAILIRLKDEGAVGSDTTSSDRLNNCFKRLFEVKRSCRVSTWNGPHPQAEVPVIASERPLHSGLTVAPRADHLLGEPSDLASAPALLGGCQAAWVDARRWYARSQLPVNPVIDP